MANIATAANRIVSAALGDEHEPVAEEEADRLQVDRRARHQLAGLLAVEEAELERLQVAVEPVAQVVLDRQRDAAGDEPPRDREARGAGARRRPRARQSRFSASRSPASIWSIARPISHGIAAVPTIAMPASTSDQIAPARYGRRKPRSLKKVRTQLHDSDGPVCKTRAANDRRDRSPQPLRHGQGRLGGAPARRPVPGARRGHGRGEDRAPRARARRRDAPPRDAGDRRAGRRRDVDARARAATRPTR